MELFYKSTNLGNDRKAGFHFTLAASISDPKKSLRGVWFVSPLISACLTEDNISSPTSFIPVLTELPHHACNIKYPPFQVTKKPTPQHREFVKPVTVVNQCR